MQIGMLVSRPCAALMHSGAGAPSRHDFSPTPTRCMRLQPISPGGWPAGIGSFSPAKWSQLFEHTADVFSRPTNRHYVRFRHSPLPRAASRP